MTAFRFVPFLIILPTVQALADGSPEVLFNDFVAEHGHALDACFDQLPPLQGVAPADFPRSEPAPQPLRRLIIALDGSGSMAGAVDGTRKMEAAQTAARTFLETVPEDVEVGLIAFGHKGNNQDDGRTESCQGVEMASPIAAGNRTELADAIGRVSATGWTPLAAAIEAAGAALPEAEGVGEQVVYIVSDGKETCGGDPVAAARALQEGPAKAVVNIIGFDLAEEDRAQLAAVAEAGGGVFEQVAADEIADRMTAVARSVAERRRIAATTVDGSQTRTANNVVTSEAITALRVCVSQAIAGENVLFRDLVTATGDRSLTGPVRPLLRARHSEVRDNVAAYAAEARAANASQTERIEATVDATREGAEASKP